MLTTTIFGFKKSETTDASSALRTAPNDNADLLEALLDRRSYAEILTSQSTSSTTAADLTTVGPSVTLTVPTNGIVEVFAQITNASPDHQGKVFLAEDGTSLGQIMLSSAASTWYTLPSSTAGTGTRVLAGHLLFPAAAGSRTYKLMYANDGSGTVPFSNRKLWVRVRTF